MVVRHEQDWDEVVLESRPHAAAEFEGVPTALRVWEGMWHSFFSDPELPESRQAYAAIVTFFGKRLAR